MKQAEPTVGKAPPYVAHNKAVPTGCSSRKSTVTILFYSSVICVPLLVFSIVLLGLVFKYRVGHVASEGSEIPGRFYLVDFPAARLIFVSSWSNSIAPRLMGVATALYLFSLTKALIRKSSSSSLTTTELPTPYQLAVLICISSGSIFQLWKYAKYRLSGSKTRLKTNSLLNHMGLVFVFF
jgi:hypothetical protein